MPVRRFDPSPGYAALFDQVKGALPGDGALRERSFERFQELGFPNQRVEAWKYTSLKTLAEREPSAPAQASVGLDALEPYLLGGDVRRLVFVNGRLAEDLSSIDGLPSGLTVEGFAKQVRANGALLADAEAERSLTALNAAMAEGGAAIALADGIVVEPVLQLLFVTTGDPSLMVNPRNVVRVGKEATLRLAETHVALGEGGFTNLVNEFTVDVDGTLEVDKLQFGAPGSVLIGQTAMRLGERARLSQTTITAGGNLVRNESLVRLEGRHTDLHLNGVYVPVSGEHVDTVIRVEHNAPDCESNQFYKGILQTGGHAAFAGKIFVDQIAQKTNAYQQNDNLMLSRDAEIDTKPELEIYADDVKCSHGATVGELDETGLFYLRSRGVDLATAEAILSFAFAGEVVEKLIHEDSQHQARRLILERLDGGEKLAELI